MSEAEELKKKWPSKERRKWLIMKRILVPALHLKNVCAHVHMPVMCVALPIHAFVWQCFKGSLQ